MNDYGYSVVTYVAQLASLAPGVAGIFLGSTVDSGPAWMCFGVGVLVSISIAAVRHHRAKASGDRLGSQPEAVKAPPPDASGRRTARALLLYLGPPSLCLGLGLLGNRFLDGSEPSRHVESLIDVTRRTKGADTIRITSWREGEREVTVRAGSPAVSGVHRGLPNGEEVLVTTRAGAFGWEWFVSVRPGRRSPPPTAR